MQRVNVVNDGKVVGWFNMDQIRGRWSDRDPISGSGSGGTGRGEAVILTAGGRWVLQSWTDWAGEEYKHRWLSPDQAREWLVANDFGEVVAEHFGALPPEVNLGGRPVTVGGLRRVIQAPTEWWARVDARAAEDGISAAEVIRRAVDQHLPVGR